MNKELPKNSDWLTMLRDGIEANEKRLDAFGFWMDKHREMHVKDIDKLLDELEGQHLDRRIIELDDVMRNNFTRRLDKLEKRFKECEEACVVEIPKGCWKCIECGHDWGDGKEIYRDNTLDATAAWCRIRGGGCGKKSVTWTPQETPTEEQDLSDEQEGDELQNMVDNFASAMSARLLDKLDAGWSGWDDPVNRQMLLRKLKEHAERAKTKADFVDVANFAAMLWDLRELEPGEPTEEPEGKIKLDDANAVMTDATKRYIAKPEAEELKSCPFCGGEADYKQGINVSSVTCHACGFHFYRGTIESPETATEAWNRRAESEELVRLRKDNEEYCAESEEYGVLNNKQAKEIARLKEEKDHIAAVLEDIQRQDGYASIEEWRSDVKISRAMVAKAKEEIARLKEELADTQGSYEAIRKRKTEMWAEQNRKWKLFNEQAAELERYKALLVEMHGSMASKYWAERIADCLAPLEEDDT